MAGSQASPNGGYSVWRLCGETYEYANILVSVQYEPSSEPAVRLADWPKDSRERHLPMNSMPAGLMFTAQMLVSTPHYGQVEIGYRCIWRQRPANSDQRTATSDQRPALAHFRVMAYYLNEVTRNDVSVYSDCLEILI